MNYNPPDEFKKMAFPVYSYVDTVMFSCIANSPENGDDLFSEIFALLTEEFPDRSFDKRSVKKQWQRILDGENIYANTDKHVIDILQLTKWIIDFGEIRPTFVSELKNNGLGIVLNNPEEVAEIYLLEWAWETLKKKNKTESFACAVTTLHHILSKKPFSKFNKVIAFLLFKKMLCIANIAPFSYPIVCELNGTDLAKFNLKDSYELLLLRFADIEFRKNACDYSVWDKVAKKHLALERLIPEFEKHEKSWKKSDLCKAVNTLLDANHRNEEDSILWFFEQIWIGNALAEESGENRDVAELIERYNSNPRVDQFDLFYFLYAAVRGQSYYSYYWNELQNRKKLAKAESKNPKKHTGKNSE